MMRYIVEPNWCRCHPETCCCDDWLVRDTDNGEKGATYFNEKDAIRLCEKLNQ